MLLGESQKVRKLGHCQSRGVCDGHKLGDCQSEGVCDGQVVQDRRLLRTVSQLQLPSSTPQTVFG